MKKKRCSKCLRPKVLDAFHWRSKAKLRRQAWCKPCASKARMEHYRRNPTATREYASRRRLVLRNRIYEYLRGKKCSDCPESDPVVLEFDHVRGVKSNHVATMVHNSVGWASVLKEIEKCEVVCANCHRRRTAKRAGWVRSLRVVA